MNYKFNEGFYWGTAISALQTEGTHEGDGKVILLLMCGLRRNLKDFLVAREIK